MYEVVDSWNKKLGFVGVADVIESHFDGWDRLEENGKPLEIRIFYQKTGEDKQHNMNVWADDNSVGYFFSSIFFTEGGTPIVHSGDKIGIAFTFQKEEDALAFKLMWS